MQTNKEAEQVTLSDLGICCGKMFREPSPAEPPKARTSASSSKRSSELSAVPFMSLDLTPGHGNLLGESYWELISPWLGGAWMLNTGVSPNDARESSLSQILQDAPPIKYYLSPKACLGILRRASERGKALPPKLERALKIQAGLMRPDGQPTDLNAFHINQRDEGIDLHGVSGALMATTNMQMQTFVTQPDEVVEGFDGYNGDLTGDVAATLGANCGMSTGRNGVMAFAANQRDEVRDLHDVAGALNAQPGMKQQTFVAAAFSAGAGASAGSIGYGEELAPTLKGSASGNCMPSVLCLNDQGGSVMECSENVSGTLRAQEHGHQPLVYENHGILEPGAPDFERKLLMLQRKPRARYRINHISWWAQEMPSEAEYAEARRNLTKVDWAVDYVITHCAPTSIALIENRHNEADPLTDFLQEVKERAHYHYWLFGHYHDNRAIDEKHILLWEQIIQVI